MGIPEIDILSRGGMGLEKVAVKITRGSLLSRPLGRGGTQVAYEDWPVDRQAIISDPLENTEYDSKAWVEARVSFASP